MGVRPVRFAGGRAELVKEEWNRSSCLRGRIHEPDQAAQAFVAPRQPCCSSAAAVTPPPLTLLRENRRVSGLIHGRKRHCVRHPPVSRCGLTVRPGAGRKSPADDSAIGTELSETDSFADRLDRGDLTGWTSTQKISDFIRHRSALSPTPKRQLRRSSRRRESSAESSPTRRTGCIEAAHGHPCSSLFFRRKTHPPAGGTAEDRAT